MLKIWGRLSSVNVQKVMICVNELRLPHERVEAGGRFGLVDTPEYRRMNPNGLVPVIDDDGFVLWESNTIVRYLARKHATGSLYPADLRAAMLAERWMDWQATQLNPALGPAFMNLVRTPEGQRDAAAVQRSIQQAEKAMATLDAYLQGRDFVAGAFSVGDIPLACSVHRWFGLPCEHEPRPNVQAWFERVKARGSCEGVLTLPLS